MKYLFLIAWFRAREKNLVDHVDIDRMIGSVGMNETFKVLNDTDYAPYLSNKSYLDIEKIIEEERIDFRKTLLKMGADQEIVKFLFLRDDLFDISKVVKEKMFEGGEDSLSQRENFYFEKIKEKEPNSPEKVDSIVFDIYFDETINFFKKNKNKRMKIFFEKYYETIKELREDPQERDKILVGMEDEIIEKSREDIEGIVPILGFFIKKRRIEYFVRSIFSSKKMGLSSEKIYKLINQKRVL